MSTFVLVHGAWHGSWVWRDVERGLRFAGHEVYTPTLTGLGDRTHLLNPTIGLDTHVRDIAAMLASEQLNDVILVGHSYAGMVLPTAALQLGSRVAQLVIVDGFLPDAGESAFSLLPDRVSAHYRRLAAEQGFGWLIPPSSLEHLGVTDPHIISAYTPRLVPQPLKTYSDSVSAPLAGLATDGTYLLCSGWRTPFEQAAERAASIGWHVHVLAADHEAALTAPEMLIGQLAALAG